MTKTRKKSTAFRKRQRKNRTQKRVNQAIDSSCQSCKDKFNKTTRKVKTLSLCSREKCICIYCFAQINATEDLLNRCGCLIYFGPLDYSNIDRLKLFCLTCDQRFNYMVELGKRCYCLRKTGICEHIGKPCSVKQVLYVGCNHKTCNSCQVVREKKGLNDLVCGVCFPTLKAKSPPPGNTYRGRRDLCVVVDSDDSPSIHSPSSDSISSDSD